MFTPPEHHHAMTEAGKVYWNVRNALGQFCRLDGTNRSVRARALAEWRAYLDARCDQAEHDTRGHYGSRALRALLSPNASLSKASQELRDWIAQHGPTLPFAAYLKQIMEEVS